MKKLMMSIFTGMFILPLFSVSAFAAPEPEPVAAHALLNDVNVSATRSVRTGPRLTVDNSGLDNAMARASNQISAIANAPDNSAAPAAQVDVATAVSVPANDDTTISDNPGRLAELQSNATAMQDVEHSQANKMLGGLSTAATGIGGMQLAQGIAEQNSDTAADADMQAYLSTFRCGLSNGVHGIAGGDAGTVPGYSAEMADLRNEYVNLADKTKSAKQDLGLAAGIESVEIIDKSALYRNEGGIARTSEFGTAAERLASGDARQRINAGALVAGAGIVGGVVGNALINRNAPTERSAEINQRYDALLKNLEEKVNVRAEVPTPCPADATGTPGNCVCNNSIYVFNVSANSCGACGAGEERTSPTTCSIVAAQVPAPEEPLITETTITPATFGNLESTNVSGTLSQMFGAAGPVVGISELNDSAKKLSTAGLFDNNSRTLSAQAAIDVDEFASEFLAAGGEGCILIEGHTDRTGSVSYNKTLSDDRARAVAARLSSRGIPASNIRAKGYGMDYCPDNGSVADNDAARCTTVNGKNPCCRSMKIKIQEGTCPI